MFRAPRNRRPRCFYTEDADRGPHHGGDDVTEGFQLPTFCSLPLLTHVVCVNKPNVQF